MYVMQNHKTISNNGEGNNWDINEQIKVKISCWILKQLVNFYWGRQELGHCQWSGLIGLKMYQEFVGNKIGIYTILIW